MGLDREAPSSTALATVMTFGCLSILYLLSFWSFPFWHFFLQFQDIPELVEIGKGLSFRNSWLLHSSHNRVRIALLTPVNPNNVSIHENLHDGSSSALRPFHLYLYEKLLIIISAKWIFSRFCRPPIKTPA